MNAITVTVFPQHIDRDRSVQLAIKTDKPFEVEYFLTSPEEALSLLAQLEQNRLALEQLAQETPT